MLFKILFFTLTAFSGVAEAGQLRSQSSTTAENTPDTRALTEYDNYAFLLESKGWGAGYYLGYHSNERARIDQDKAKFVYHNYHLEKYDDTGKTGKCYEMDDTYYVNLRDCDYEDVKQKWLISEAPKEYGHYYTVSNAYYGYVMEYSATDEYYLTTRSLKDVKYNDAEYMNKILFYKEAAYDEKDGKACRTSNGGSGSDGGKDFVVYKASRDQCEKFCSDDYKCKGLEYSNTNGYGRCEIWYTKPERFETKRGFDCYVKLH